jgi:hypothetical protein
LPGVASSCGLSSVSEASVSMLAVLSGAKKFLVGTVLGVVLTAAGAAVTNIFFEFGLPRCCCGVCAPELLGSPPPG